MPERITKRLAVHHQIRGRTTPNHLNNPQYQTRFWAYSLLAENLTNSQKLGGSPAILGAYEYGIAPFQTKASKVLPSLGRIPSRISNPSRIAFLHSVLKVFTVIHRSAKAKNRMGAM